MYDVAECPFLPVFAANAADARESDRLIAAHEEPRRDVVIFFTPRSGSTWLSELLANHRGFGQPEEWFNPDHIAANAARLKSASMDRYLSAIRRTAHAPITGVFSCEITFFQLELVERFASFFEVFSPARTAFFYLTRRDLALQSVSLYKAETLRLYNSPDGEIGVADFTVPFDAGKIAGWADHIYAQEIGCEALFSKLDVSPCRLVYEDMIDAGPQRTCRLFCDVLGVEFDPARANVSLQKVSTDRNIEFAARFVHSGASAILDQPRRLESVL